MQRMPRLGFDRRPEIHTLPQNYSLSETLFVPALRCLSSVAGGEPSPDQAATVFNCLPLLIHRPSFPDSKIYVLALMALFHANCVELRDLCLNIIDAQPIPWWPVTLIQSPEDRNLLERLCRTLVDTNTPAVPIAALHFELLIASIISYSSRSQPEIDRGQSALQSLLDFRNRFPDLRDPSPLNMEDPFPRLKSETEGSRQGSMLRAMQSIVDFCEAGMTAPDDNARVIWLNELQKWKDNCKPSTARIVLPIPAEGGSPSPGQSGSSPNAAPPDTARGAE
ncbi:hypothetical protein FRC06_011068 [Ceratobasidium sp. 370]|nr:hypothetical protein FRC06_011068 [Ceratobasidium sp. 370]